MGYGYGHGWGMMGWGGYGYGLIHLVVTIVILVAIVAFIVWLVRSITGPSMHYAQPHRPPGLDALEERYARGEIGRDEYLQKKKDIGG